MKLLTLKLKNFKGIKDFTLTLDGNDATVYGDNAVGKSTLFDSFLWLLFSKDSQGKKDFDIKTLDSSGQVIHGLEHEVEASLAQGSTIITLRKVFAEKWTKKRGSATSEFTGHETDHFVDGVPVKKNEYDAAIAELAGKEEVFKLLTSPAHFNEQLKWEERRRIILEVCGDLTDDEVISADEKLAKLPEILKGRKSEDHRKVIAASKTEINKKLVEIPNRIDEVMRGLPDITGLSEGEIGNQLLHLRTAKRQKEEKLLQLQSGGEAAQLKNKLALIESELQDIKNEHRAKVNALVGGKRTALTEVELQVDYSLKRKLGELNSQHESNTKRLAKLEEDRAKLRAKWLEEDARILEFSQETVCPTCGHDIAEEKLVEAQNGALAHFNRTKAEKLEAITKEGQGIKAEIEKLSGANTQVLKSMEDMIAQKAEAEQLAETLREEIKAVGTDNDLSKNPTYIQKIQEKSEVEQDMSMLGEGSREAVKVAEEEVRDFEYRLKGMEQSLADVKRYEDGQVRIKELKDQEKLLAAEYSKLEGDLYLCEQFVRSKVSMLEGKINSRFKYARFKMFETQINGGVTETCETLYSGVPYSSGLNNAARINVGLDIINTLSERYGFTAPIFIDNRESVTKLIATEAQMISLVVSEQDKILRVVTEDNQNKNSEVA